jgi:hypothetical protein
MLGGQLLNNPPEAVDDFYEVVVGSSDVNFDVLINDSDPDDDPLTITNVSPLGPTFGIAIIAADGGSVIYSLPPFVPTPVPPDRFVYTITDSKEAFSEAVIEVTILPNDLNANDDYISTDEDNFVDINALGNDTGTPPLAIDSFTQGSDGTVTENPDETLRYNPNPDFFGEDSFTYTITNDGINFDTATVFVNVGPVNDDPVAVPDSYTVFASDPTVIFDVLINDYDVDGDAITLDPSVIPVTPASGIAIVVGNVI